MKSAVVDRQSATIKIVQDGQVVRELPFRILSNDAVIVGAKLFSAPTADLRKWGEESTNGNRRHDEGWIAREAREGDGPTFTYAMPIRILHWVPTGPKEEFFRKLFALERKLRELKKDRTVAIEAKKFPLLGILDSMITDLEEQIRSLELEEKTRRAYAKRQSRQKRPSKVERMKKSKGRRSKSNEEKPEGGGKKKKRGKKKGGGGENAKQGNARGKSAGNRGKK